MTGFRTLVFLNASSLLHLQQDAARSCLRLVITLITPPHQSPLGVLSCFLQACAASEDVRQFGRTKNMIQNQAGVIISPDFCSIGQ